ncbi:endonuclease [Streptomyces sp. NPDC054933]|jgi:endonuclease III
MPTNTSTTRSLLHDHGRTFAADAGIRVRNTPQPLYQLLVLACLLSARIRASVGTAAARALFDAGLRDPQRMADTSWQQRVDALGEGGYRRYDERTATQLGDGARYLLDAYGGDLRRLRAEADGDVRTLRRLLRKLPGLGPVGADIFLREVQTTWPEVAPYFDGKAVEGAHKLGLPESPEALARLVGDDEYDVFAAALVRAALDKHVVSALTAA